MPSQRKNGKWQVNYRDANGKRHSKSGFATEEEAQAWADEGSALRKAAKKRKREASTQEERRAAGLEKSGDNNATEAKAIEEVSKILEKLELKLVRDGAKNDVGLRKKVHHLIDLWWGVQIKSCAKRHSGNRHRHGRAQFSHVNTYPKSIVMCVLLDPLTIWLRHGRDLAKKGATLNESQLPEFTDALCYQEDEDGEVVENTLEESLMAMFNDEAYAYEPQPINTFDLQLSTLHFLEDWAHRLYLRSRNRPEASIRRAIGDVENGHHDDVEDGDKFQEKVGWLKPTGSIQISLFKQAGQNLSGTQLHGPYEENDFDVLRVFVLYKMNDDGTSVTVSLERKKYNMAYSPESPEYQGAIADIRSWQLLGYFKIPIATLVAKGLIKTATSAGQMTFNALLPEDVCTKINHPLPKQIRTKGKNKTNTWTRDFFHLCAPFLPEN